MYCNSCGRKVSEDVKFCPMCGTEVTNEIKNKKGIVPFVIAGAVGAFLVIGLVILFINRKPTINLNDYLEVEVSGYDTMGKVSYDFDKAALKEDYGDIIEKNMDKEMINSFGMGKYAESIGVQALIMNCIDGSFDKRSELCNGDTATFTWECEDEIAKETYGVKLKYSDVEVKIEDLEELEEVNPFEGIDVVFSGYSPKGEAEIVIDKDKVVIPELKYELSQSSDLKNGDIVTIRVSNIIWDPEYFEKEYGVTLTEMEKEYVVDGLPVSVDSPKEINDEMFGQLQDEAYKILSEEMSYNDFQYMENYWLDSSENYYSYYANDYENALLFVYKTKVGGQEKFYGVCFENLVIDKEKVTYENSSVDGTWNIQEYVEKQMAKRGLDSYEKNIGISMSLPIEVAVAVETEVDVENLTESQQDMYYIMDTLADRCYYDVYAPNDPNFFWSALRTFVSYNSANWSDGYSEMGLSVEQDKVEIIAAGLFEAYDELLEIPEAEYIVYANGSYIFMAGDRGMEYTKITSWTMEADGTEKVTMELIDEMENEVFAIYEFTLVENPRLQYDNEQVFQYSVRDVEKLY